ncbi:MAG: DUF3048 domain-containing protein [Oscillospiraceae bacterium]|nr:DUF3048 domain-containing protein [Oscillospiraceae bacterium]
MKRVVSLLLAALCVVSLFGCGILEREKENPAPPSINTGIDISSVYDSMQGDGEMGAEIVTSEKSAYNPLTGEYTMALDRVGKRPIAVSVNNISMSWPQYGISKADYILEIETEGGITRLMCLFSDTREVEMIGSVRSLRDQFVEALFPLDPIIVHIGTSIYADKVIAQYNYKTLDGGNYASTIWTDRARAATYSSEHTKFTGGSAIEKGIASAKIQTDSYSSISAFNFIDPEEDVVIPSGGAASTVKYNFSSGYDGDFRYDSATGKYKKWQFGRQHVDAGNENQQLEFDNLFLLFADISLYPGQSSGLVDVKYSNGGEGYYFSQGRYEKITWRKDDYPSNFIFTKQDGTELEVNVGITHMGVVNKDNEARLVIS